MAASAIYTYIQIHGVDKLVEVCNSRLPFLAPKYKLLLHYDDLQEYYDSSGG
jgi:hypothetical protein